MTTPPAPSVSQSELAGIANASVVLGQENENFEHGEGGDAISEAGSDAAIVVNAFELAASMRIPPALAAKPLGEAKGPQIRVNHTVVAFEGTLYTYGGRSPNGGQYFGSVSKYVPSRVSWAELETKGSTPMRRGDHSAVVIADKMYIYGGRKQTSIMDDMFTFDFILQTWEKVSYEASSGPGPLFNHSAVYCASMKVMYIVGGVHVQNSRRHLLYGFDVGSRFWKPIRGPPTVDVSELQHCIGQLDEENGKLILMGVVEDATLASLYTESALAAAQQRTVSDASFGGGTSISLEGPLRAGSLGRSHSLSPESGGGAVKNKMTRIAENAFTMMLMMDVRTNMWKRIRTEVSPESPLPFSMEHISLAVLANISKQPHAFSQAKKMWYFPVNLRELDETAQAKAKGTTNSSAKTLGSSKGLARLQAPRRGPNRSQPGDKAAPQPPSWMATFGAEYGVFAFSFSSMTWSLVPLVIPKARRGGPNPDEAAAASGREREFFTLRSLGEFESKYGMVCYPIRAAGATRDLIVLYGGVNLSDYCFSMMTPTIPPKPKGRHALDVASRATPTGMTWHGEDDEGDDISLAPTPTPPQPPLAGRVSPGQVSLQGVITTNTPPTAASNMPQLSLAGVVRTQAIGRLGRLKKSKANDNTRVVIPLHPSTSASASMGAVQSMSNASPVVVLDSAERVNSWVHQYYREECRWMQEQRFAVEKQFSVAKRVALKSLQSSSNKQNVSAAQQEGGDSLAVSIAIPGMPRTKVQKMLNVTDADIAQRRDAMAKKKPQDLKEEKIRTAAVVGTLLFDVVDLHPDVLPRKPPGSPKRKSVAPGRSGSRFSRRSSRIDEDRAPSGISFADVASVIHSVPNSQQRSSEPGSPAGGVPDSTVEALPSQQVVDARRVAKLNWAILRRHVVSGNAARVLSMVEEEKNPDISWWVPQPVSSAPQLAFGPSLSTFQVVKGTGGADENTRVIAFVPTKPVPYTLTSAPGVGRISFHVGANGTLQYGLERDRGE